MTPRRRAPTADDVSAANTSDEKRAIMAALRTTAERLGPDGGGLVVTTLRLPKLLHTQLGIAAKIEPDFTSMNDIAIAALQEWFARHGYADS